MKKFVLFCVIATIALACIAYFNLNNDNNDGGNKTGKGIDKPLVPNYTVTFDTNGGSKIGSKSLNVLESVSAPTKDDHLFDGWYRDETLTTPVVFPLTLEADTTIYAKWLKTKDEYRCKEGNIKCWDGHSPSITWKMTPDGFDWERLEERGVSSVEITVNYKVKYRKDYDVPLDIGYAGAPKYEMSILDSKGVGKIWEDLSTTTSLKDKTRTITLGIADIKDEKLYLSFSTNNIQNIIYFEEISVTYQCK